MGTISWESLLISLGLGAISVPIARMPKPRLFWGSAWADPTSIPWIVGLFLYGPVSSLISSFIGAVGIWRTSPELTPGVGAFLKFLGTSTVWATAAIVIAFKFGGLYPNPALHDFRIAFAIAALAGVVRASVILPLDYAIFIPYYRSVYAGHSVSRAEAIGEFGGPGRYIAILGCFNIWLSLFDLLVPWLLVYPTGLVRVVA